MNKAALFASVWGISLLISALLRFWGQQHPQPLEPSAIPILVLLLMPSGLMAGWLLWSSRGSGESE
ncbi:hypothetical protein [Synechococcus sp. UW179A]|uniref:hypothetical protein n=1 Tax=Synechococcus sp. UW179A TaxID=2575510 RepID=UPI001FCC59F7|nr:hypothetical protein [Synechococcus sp. UW179A]